MLLKEILSFSQVPLRSINLEAAHLRKQATAVPRMSVPKISLPSCLTSLLQHFPSKYQWQAVTGLLQFCYQGIFCDAFVASSALSQVILCIFVNLGFLERSLKQSCPLDKSIDLTEL